MNLQQAADQAIWERAKHNTYSVITTDSDFVAMAQRLGWPPKIIHIEQRDFPLPAIENLLRRSAVRITDFHKDPAIGLLVLRRQTGRTVRPSVRYAFYCDLNRIRSYIRNG